MLISFQSIERLIESHGQNPIELEPYAIHLWGIELDGSPQCVEQCVGWLDDVERQRAARFVREDIRQHYVLAHGGLRTLLGRYLRVRPDEVTLDRRATGKPFLTEKQPGRSGITFNLSHAHGRALIAVSRAQEVGVDLECVRSGVEVATLAERYFTRSEHATIMQCGEGHRATKFFRYWVAKEALLKAEGIGLQGLSDCEILFETEEAEADVRTRLGPRFQNPLQVYLLSCGQGWEAAVAAQRVDALKPCGPEQP